ncbi:MAG: hypothetical protein WDA11_06140 [Thiohalomonadaceae bacterium]
MSRGRSEAVSLRSCVSSLRRTRHLNRFRHWPLHVNVAYQA